MYYKNAKAALIIFDITKKKSFENARSWIDELNENASLDILIALVANKIDLVDDYQLNHEVRIIVVFVIPIKIILDLSAINNINKKGTNPRYIILK